ncbi:TPA: hypothetical protein SIC63_002206 [Pasteurella multocida]|uniref:hypothetical protein n=2 Tax=Pasteurella multocida TaxID=747 RepID=UPI00299FC14C|nr:hypothetical protein [Pasteurella multocida]HEH9625689.1 hypothetical protein [Pasteurella multocida]HEH9638679.1 hypothetical protein [Pasteurella multocida]HEH9660984.1 hypothetical protein [Pasteurella multocida]HEH9663264.1 hypothetical protein [Pasteurella multocida]
MTILNNEADRRELKTFFEKRISEYQQDLCQEGLTQQQYDILRGQVRELQSLISTLKLNQFATAL